jgi:ABC-type multidrug transport system fused ATPase/permease subunit
VTTCLFPLLYLTLELPKRIINDAIDAQVLPIVVLGVEMDQTTLLAILCGAFLLAVLAHGLLKMRINTMKGILAERMLRRLRYTLIARILRFPNPYFERTSQGELVSMVTSEAEPMGGLMGDAISQPVLQAGQMLTILAFLFVQSVWFGLAACALIPLQAWLIPRLQRQINLLNKKRVVQVRALAAEIGESAAGASTLRTNGGWRYRRSMISDRLARLYAIRFEIFQKKFFMKFLNNFLTQLTPFFFFSVGGYLVIQGNVSLGALVAALAAYKDLSSPWKELLAYYNQVQDMSLRWETITERFAPPGMVDPELFDGEPDGIPSLRGDVVMTDVTVQDEDGNAVLEDLTVTLPEGRLVGISAPSEEDRRAFAELLSRELLATSGRVEIAGHRITGLHQAVIAQRIGLATSRPVLFQGTFGENVMMPLRYRPLSSDGAETWVRESIGAGNSADPLDAQWLDPSLAGESDAAMLHGWWMRIMDSAGSGSSLYRRGLEQKLAATSAPELCEKLVALRPRVAEALTSAKLARHVHVFDPERYNPALPVGDNLIFATPRQPITTELLAAQTEFMALLRDLGLDSVLLGLTRDVIETLRQIFGTDGIDHPLFRKLGLEPVTFETAIALIDAHRDRGWDDLGDDDLALMMTIPFRISAEQIGPAFSDEIKQQILDLRASHGAQMRAALADVYAPLDAGGIAVGLTVLENALFGKLSDSAAGKADDVQNSVARTLEEGGARDLVVRLIFDVPITLGGANLPAALAEPLALCRAVIKKPDVLVLDNALASFGPEALGDVVENLRALLPDSLIVVLRDKFADPGMFDLHLELVQGRIASGEARVSDTGDSAARADLARKVRALEQTRLFSGLSRKQLRLLAFGARWYSAAAGEYVFHKDDDPSDGTYMVIDGRAGLYLPKEDGPDQLITMVEPGTLVGELGLIRGVPRALDMKAETDLSCLRIGAEEFLAVVENDAATSFKLLQVVAGYV